MCVGWTISTIADLGRDSLIYTGGTASLHRIIGWPEQTGHTIHFPIKLHTDPSSDTLYNPSADQIHR